MISTQEAPIILTGEYSGFFNSFESIASNQRVSGLHGLRTKPELDKCCICFSDMTIRNPVMLFNCKLHKGHKRCI